MKRMIPFAVALTMASPLSAEDLRPAPDYYVDTLFAVTMAEALAISCAPMGMDLLAAGSATTELQEQLTADGFDTDMLATQMIDTSPALLDLQTAFLEKHPDLSEPDEDAVCAAARAELAEETAIGAYLVEAVE
jgi:hypothetical protein